MSSLTTYHETSLDDIYDVLSKDETFCKILDREHKTERNLCKVCGAKSVGYSYYGIICCNACKAFFLRAVQQRKQLVCTARNDCFIHCRKCRLDRCLEAGMRPELVNKQQQRIMLPAVRAMFTLQDEIWVRGVWAGVLASASKFLLYHDKTDCLKKLVDHLFCGKPVKGTLYNDPEHESRVFEHMSAFYSTLPEFNKCSQKKAWRRLMENVPLASEITLAQCVSSSHATQVYFNEIASSLSLEDDQSDLFRMLNKRLKHDLPKALDYDNTYTRVMSNSRDQHKTNVAKFGKWPVDLISTTLTTLVIIFENDNIAKKKYLKMLFQYCQLKGMLDLDNFVKEVATCAKTLREMRNMRLPSID